MTSTIQQIRSEYLQIDAAAERIMANKAECTKNGTPYYGATDLTVVQKTRYAELAKQIMGATKELKREEITIFQHVFDTANENFTFYYGEKEGQARLIPISTREIGILYFQRIQEGSCRWPIQNPETNEFFVPVFNETKKVFPDPFERDEKTYFRMTIEQAENDKNSREFKILEALPPHAQKIHDLVGEYLYSKLLELFPGQFPKV